MLDLQSLCWLATILPRCDVTRQPFSFPSILYYDNYYDIMIYTKNRIIHSTPLITRTNVLIQTIQRDYYFEIISLAQIFLFLRQKTRVSRGKTCTIINSIGEKKYKFSIISIFPLPFIINSRPFINFSRGRSFIFPSNLFSIYLNEDLCWISVPSPPPRNIVRQNQLSSNQQLPNREREREREKGLFFLALHVQPDSRGEGKRSPDKTGPLSGTLP